MKTCLTRSPLLLALLVVLAGCELFGGNDDEPEAASVAFHIDNLVDGRNLALDTGTYTSAAGHTYSVSLLEYIVTDIQLHLADGTTVALEHAHYCNEADHDTHELHDVPIPAGSYTALTFTFGVAQDENVFGTLPNTTHFANMMWPMMMPMGDGANERYHYMRFEGRYGDQDATFRIHTGPSSGNDYSFDVNLPLAMEVEGGSEVHMHVNMNVDKWLDGANVWDFDDFGMIMGNPDAQALIRANGQGVFTLGDVHV